jgi:hypothetical protein
MTLAIKNPVFLFQTKALIFLGNKSSGAVDDELHLVLPINERNRIWDHLKYQKQNPTSLLRNGVLIVRT